MVVRFRLEVELVSIKILNLSNLSHFSGVSSLGIVRPVINAVICLVFTKDLIVP